MMSGIQGSKQEELAGLMRRAQGCRRVVYAGILIVFLIGCNPSARSLPTATLVPPTPTPTSIPTPAHPPTAVEFVGQVSATEDYKTRPNDGGSMQPTPLVLARQGSFFVNEQNITTSFPSGADTLAPGHFSTMGMYVQYAIPQAWDERSYPVVMVHGAGHTGKTYEETPDGRMGWAEYFVRLGVPVYLVDHSGRARSGFDPSAVNQAKLEGNATLLPSFRKFTNEEAWMLFRFGPAPFVPYENTQFPVEAQDQYFAQLVPNTETSLPGGGQNTVNALTALLEQIGPAVILVHSQSGAYGIGTAIARPDLVKAVVSIEPQSCAISDDHVQAVFTQVALLSMYGDFFGAVEGNGPERMAECVQTVERIRAAGGTAENIYLPERGIQGNSHMLMMDRNNQQLANIIFDWLLRNVNTQ